MCKALILTKKNVQIFCKTNYTVSGSLIYKIGEGCKTGKSNDFQWFLQVGQQWIDTKYVSKTYSRCHILHYPDQSSRIFGEKSYLYLWQKWHSYWGIFPNYILLRSSHWDGSYIYQFKNLFRLDTKHNSEARQTYHTEKNRFASDLSITTKSTLVLYVHKTTDTKYHTIFNSPAVCRHLISVNKIFR